MQKMQNRRLLFGVIIKILLFIGVIILALVLINSLFIAKEKKSVLNDEIKVIAEIDLADMQNGQVRKIRWKNREVAVLLRQFSEQLLESPITDKVENTHSSINTQTRSIKQEYFVYFNMGDSKNCPLHYAAGVLKDICSSNRFNEAGMDINGNLQAYKIEIPPHYFEENRVIFGKWNP